MSTDPTPPLPIPPVQGSGPKPFAHQAAKGSWSSVIIVFLLVAFGRSVGQKVIVELVALALVLVGLGLGITALLGIRKHGTKGILVTALAGMAANGLLLLIFTTNFVVARAKFAGSREITGVMSTKMREELFQNSRMSFKYNRQYKVQSIGVKGQIVLQHPDSNVLITDHGQKLELEESLGQFAEGIKADFERQNYSDITKGDFEKIRLPDFSAGRIQLKYTRPREGRLVADLYLLGNETNSYSLAHYYPEKRSTIAPELFGTVLKSFSAATNTLH